MTVQELREDRLVDALDIDSAAVNPLSEVGDATHAIGEAVPGIAPVREVLLEGIDVRRQRPFVEPFVKAESRLADRIP